MTIGGVGGFGLFVLVALPGRFGLGSFGDPGFLDFENAESRLDLKHVFRLFDDLALNDAALGQLKRVGHQRTRRAEQEDDSEVIRHECSMHCEHAHDYTPFLAPLASIIYNHRPCRASCCPRRPRGPVHACTTVIAES